METREEIFLTNFYHKYHSKFFLHAYAILKDRANAEVAVQEAYVVLWRKIDEVINYENPAAWMKRVIEHTSLHILRELGRTKAVLIPLEELTPGHEPTAMDQGDFELRDCCLKVISKEELDFFLRIAYGQASFIVESERLGITLNACYKRFERIRTKLQKALR